MLHIGKRNKLEVVKKVDFGYYLDGGPYGEILLPANTAPEDLEPEEEIEVFIYTDSEDRIIATTLQPKVMADEFACLVVKQNGPNGAYLDWGIPGKDLLVPFGEQRIKMEEGEAYIVYAYLDEQSDRMAATSKIGRLLEYEVEGLAEGDEVEVMAVTATDLGWKVIVNNEFWGMLFHSEIFRDIKRGDQLKAFVKHIREDGKVDLTLQKQGYEQVEDTAQWLVDVIQEKDGFLALTDKSSPQDIYQQLKVSKKVFKKAIGNLYRKKLITLEKDGVRWNSNS